MTIRFLPIGIATAALLCLCSRQYAGGTSSSENAKVGGVITDTAGTPASGTSVLLIPSAFDPARDRIATSARTDTTSGNGSYSFDRVGPGSYNLQATNPARGTWLLVQGIELKEHDSLLVAPSTLRKPGTIVVAISNPANFSGGSIVIPGTTRQIKVPPNAGSVTLDSVPYGNINSLVLEQGAAVVQIAANVNVAPADTAYVANSAKITINTSSTGASCDTLITRFPLLVRLDSTFAFGQARADGGDIRLAKADGTPLRFEIAQWDTAAKQAALWVSVDTVYPNNASQYITMTWGFSSTQNASSGAAVFDTALGFAGVWHLDDPLTAYGTADGFKDATQNHAYAGNFTNSVDRSGIDGAGHDFNGTDFILVSKPIISLSSSDFTIALWVNLRRERCTIFSKDTAQGQDSCAQRLFCGDVAGDSSGLYPAFGGNGDGTAVSSTPLTLNVWHNVVFTWSASSKTASFFIDGVQSGLASNSFSIGCADNPRDRIVFGYDNQYLFGYLDELQISDAARSAGWLRLAYENQRSGSKLVSVAP
jgi:hypothetical protein